MRDTQYQSAVTDLRKAGLNPILAARVGGNATPPSYPVPQWQRFEGRPNEAINSAIALKTNTQNLKNLKQEENLLISQGVESNARADETRARIKKIDQEIEMLRSQNVGAGVDARFQQQFGELLRVVEAGGSAADIGLKLLNMITGLKKGKGTAKSQGTHTSEIRTDRRGNKSHVERIVQPIERVK